MQANRKLYLTFEGIPFQFGRQTECADSWCIVLLYSKNRMILAQPFGYNMHNTDDRAVNWRSRSFKDINFCCNRKPIYDFLVVINCHLSSISHHFPDIYRREFENHTTLLWAPYRGSLNILPSNLALKELRHSAIFYWNCIILALAVLSQYTRVRDRR